MATDKFNNCLLENILNILKKNYKKNLIATVKYYF